MSDMGWSQYIRGLDDAAAMEEQAREHDMLPHLAKHCDYDSPHEMYRVFYKYTACGPWVSVRVNGGWVHCQNLHKLGTWAEMLRRGDLVDEVLVGSIVEGSDAEATPVPVRLGDIRSKRSKRGTITATSVRAALSAAVEEVNDEACALWDEANQEEDE
jgi:hypothetical protein